MHNRDMEPPEERGLRLAELVAGLSLMTDLGMGQPMEQAMTTCLLAVDAGRELDLEPSELQEVFYLSLLRFVGCTADASEFAASVGGDDIGQRAALAPVISADISEYMRWMLRHFAEGQPATRRARLIAAELVMGMGNARRSIADHCQVAQMLAPRIGFSTSVALHIGSSFERWDGKGIPGKLKGESIPVPCRIVAVARDADIFSRLGGWTLVSEQLRLRRGKAYDPAVVDIFLARGATWLSMVERDGIWDQVIAAEPSPHAVVSDTALEEVLCAFADLADLKAPQAAGHSRAVASIAWAAGRALGLGSQESETLRNAALLHDLGKAGIPSGILDQHGPLSAGQWERVRLHPYYTERMLSYVPRLREAGAIAGAHHECLDGSGYHRGVTADSLPAAARILSAANTFHALQIQRPYRPALGAEEAARELRARAEQGRLDRAAVSAVLETSGHRAGHLKTGGPHGLTDREVEVLRLIARGASNRVVAERLTISVKTAGRHVENIYAKTGVSSRATAALYAMQHDLL
jgi:HD-GYP domain-containing protein (c-di-GMP phosphodiesterase class II)